MIITTCKRCANAHIECEGLSLGCARRTKYSASRPVMVCAGQCCDLTWAEAAIVRCLLAASTRVVTTVELIEWLWGERADGGPELADKNIALHVFRVRNKIRLVGGTAEIRNYYGGYSLILTPSHSEANAA